MDNKIVERADENNFLEAIEKVSKDYNISEEDAGQYLMSLGPKKLTQMGLMSNGRSWREGYTKPDIQTKKNKNKKKNKMAKKARKANR